MICSDILGEIIETAVKDSSETVDQVCDSIMDILNLDIIKPGQPLHLLGSNLLRRVSYGARIGRA